jgi:ribosomal protein S27AE
MGDDLVLQTIYRIWCARCGGAVFSTTNKKAAQSGLTDHAEVHVQADKCDHPLQSRMYGIGDQPTQTCGKCGFNLPVTWDREGSDSMLAPTAEPEEA